jgi:carbamoyl-phosphate synthase small subunit
VHLLKKRPKALLVLEDGSIYRGYAFAHVGQSMGEVVFNTGMTGYQEILTDPSYKEQIVTMTYPLIGSYGINPDDMESAKIHLEGFVVKEYQPFPSNWRSRKTLKEFLEEHKKLGVEGIDTRALTRRIRLAGAMKGILSTETDDTRLLLDKVRAYPGLVGRDLIPFVTCEKPYLWKDNGPKPIELLGKTKSRGRLRVVVIDCGVKYNILRNLERRDCDVIVVPCQTTAKEVRAYKPDGVLLSNGPGDPATLPYIVNTVRDLLGQTPIFGICLGHQILGQALGGTTAKLKFGHHGINQPAKNVKRNWVEITSQNHGFIVVPESLAGKLDKTHLNLNDGTLEGLFVPDKKAFSVQYHPEAAPGPQDANYLFTEFTDLMLREKRKHAKA